MKLMKSTEDILEIVKKLSGKGVKFIHKPDMMGAYGSIKVARKNMPEHIMYYKLEEGINWAIAHECGHVIRMFGVPVEDRKIPMASRENRYIGAKELEADILKLSNFIPVEGLTELFKLWFDGTIQWLTSMPIDVQIEKWIYENYSEIRNEQKVSLDRIMEESALCINVEYKQITPKKVYRTMVCLNYAYAICIDSILGTDYTNPYDVVFDEFGECALNTVNIALQEDKGYKQDIKNINQIAEMLNIRKWYSWTDFENIPADYTK